MESNKKLTNRALKSGDWISNRVK